RATHASRPPLLLKPAALLANRAWRQGIDDRRKNLDNPRNEATVLAIEVTALAFYARSGQPENFGWLDRAGEGKKSFRHRRRLVEIHQTWFSGRTAHDAEKTAFGHFGQGARTKKMIGLHVAATLR